MNRVPKLRFKEFTDEWKEKEIENIFEISKSKYNPLKETKEYPCIELESLSQETGKILKIFNSLEQKSIKNKFLKDEILFGKLRPYLKKYWYSNFDGVCSSEIWVLNSKNNINKFIYYFIQGENFISLANTTSGTKMPRADWDLIKNEFFSIPNIQEQQKIADFLSNVDKKISITEEKLNLFNEYKKGIMQKIFKQELRFKDENGNDYPEWEEKALNLIFERITEKNIENNNNVLTISAQYGLISQTDFFNKSVAGKDLTKYYLLHRNDFAYNKSYSTGYPMGAIKRLTRYDKGIVSTLYICFRVKNNDNVNFLEQFFESGKIEKSIQDIAQEGARNHGLLNINIGDFFDIAIKLPCLEEQQKIADFLSAIDTKIEKISDELKNLKEFKKGLLQQMFV